MFIIKLLSQHVSGIIMPIIRRTRLCTTTYGVLNWLCWLWLAVVVWSCVVSCVHCVKVLLMMGIMMPETCWERSLIINIELVASCWFLSLHSTSTSLTHSQPKSLYNTLNYHCWFTIKQVICCGCFTPQFSSHFSFNSKTEHDPKTKR